jgi:hypothetical protein
VAFWVTFLLQRVRTEFWGGFIVGSWVFTRSRVAFPVESRGLLDSKRFALLPPATSAHARCKRSTAGW